MRTVFRVLSVLAIPLLAGGTFCQAQRVSTPERQPLFIENHGQWDPRARFLMQTGGMDLWITDNGIVYDLHRETPIERNGGLGTTAVDGPLRPNGTPERPGVAEPPRLQRSGQVVRVRFDGADNGGRAIGLERRAEHYNYFLGNDPRRWATTVPIYERATIQHLYKGIDAVLYLDGGVPRYDLVVAPGADPSRVRMRFEGADGVTITGDGTLEVATGMGDLQQRGLYAYQEIEGKRRQVACSFVVGTDGTVGFSTGSYDPKRPLVIDPLVYSTLIGGSDADYATAMDLDASGSVYVSGWTYSTDYPVTAGAYQSTNPLAFDAMVSKLDPSAVGSAQLVSSTFIGGAGGDGSIDMAIDGAGDVYLTGFTDSDDYPTTSGALSATRGGSVDGFVTKLDLSATGSAQLLYSTYVGGSDFEQSSGIAVDPDGNIVVTGVSASSDYPTTSDAYATTLTHGSYDVYLTKLDPSATGSAQLLYSTLIGGADYDAGHSVGVDGSSNIYITGYTLSNDYPTSSGAFATTNSGGFDIFVTRLGLADSGGIELDYSTYLGGSGDDTEYGIAIDGSGGVYLSGWTNSTDFPTSADAYASSNAGGTDAFVARIDPSASGSAQLAYSTYIGGSDEDFGYGVTLDAGENIWFTGWTASTDYPTTADALWPTHAGGANDVPVTKLDLTQTGSAQLAYSTFVGGTDDEQGNGIAMDALGRVFIAGYTTSTDYPTSSGAYSSANSGGYDIFVTELSFAEIDLTSFDGGSYCAGTTWSIDWTSSGISNLRIEYSSDGGANWTAITASTPASAGSYSWTIPSTQAAGSAYRIRISDASDATTSDQSDADFTIDRPAAITAQPQAIVACIGNPATLSVTATGAGLTYQWRKAGVPIPGATSSTYVIANPTVASAGYYNVVVTGTCGSPVSSSFAFVSVKSPQVITQQPTSRTVCMGANTTFNVSATGSNLTYQWKLNGVDIPGANNAHYTVHNASFGNVGTYSVVVGGACPISVTSSGATLTVNQTTQIMAQPQSQSVCYFVPAQLQVWAVGTSLTYQWRLNGTNIPGATSSTSMTNTAGNYSVVVSGACGNPVTSSTATLTVLPPPFITSHPSSRTVCAGQSVTFSVGASGPGLSYQWRRNGVNVGSNSPFHTIGVVSSSDAGTYSVIVYGQCGTAQSNNATLTVNTAPWISSQSPSTQHRTVGSSITFSVFASGTGLTYQWKKGNAPILGATGPSYTISNVVMSSAATYYCVVTGTCGQTMSSGMTLTVSIFKPTVPSTGNGALAPTLAVSPNPAGDVARIDLRIPAGMPGTRTLMLYDESGGLRRDLSAALKEDESQTLPLDVSELPSGRYHVRLRVDGHDAVEATVVVVR